MTKLANMKVSMTDPISKVMIKDFRNMSSSMPIPELARVLEKRDFVLVDGTCIASNIDLLTFMSNNEGI